MIRAVIFDLDQTLLDRDASLLAFLQWQCRGMLRGQLPREDTFIARFLELDANGTVWKDRVYETLVEEFRISRWTSAELLASYELCFCGFSIAKAGAAEAIRRLSGHHTLGLISNGRSPFQERNFHGLGLPAAFRSVLVSGAIGLRKPDRRIFERSCRELGVLPSEAVFVGDDPSSDIRGAADAGLHTIFIPGRLHPACESASATCTDLTHLHRIVRQLP